MYRLRHLFAIGLAIGSAFQAVNAQTCETDYPQSTPTSRFDIHGDGTVTDRQTGLVWKQCLQGISGSQCQQGTAIQVTWEEGLQEINNTSVGWRVPNIKELQSIVEDQCSVPAINSSVFPGESMGSVWSSSPSGYRFDAWLVRFTDGSTAHYGRNMLSNVRLVRNEQ